jgi:hypothetical protein
VSTFTRRAIWEETVELITRRPWGAILPDFTSEINVSRLTLKNLPHQLAISTLQFANQFLMSYC